VKKVTDKDSGKSSEVACPSGYVSDKYTTKYKKIEISVLFNTTLTFRPQMDSSLFTCEPMELRPLFAQRFVVGTNIFHDTF
jgi:hypothetical protein